MMTIFTMVLRKKWKGSRGTFTRTAVMMKTSMMTKRLPMTRRRCEILTGEGKEEAQGQAWSSR